MSKIDVLPCVDGDPGFVRLVDHMGNDLSVVRSARVSYNADWRGDKPPDEIMGKDEKLIHYLHKHKHTSPFESVVFTFEVKAPIFVFRQMHRHRTQSINEVSARYTELDEGFYVPELNQITTQSTTNKQMRTTEVSPRALLIQSTIHTMCEHAFNSYREMIEQGCARELARSVLPVAAYSRMFTTMNLHNLFHLLTLRLHEHTQYETRVYAQAMLDLIKPIVPTCVAAFQTKE